MQLLLSPLILLRPLWLIAHETLRLELFKPSLPIRVLTLRRRLGPLLRERKLPPCVLLWGRHNPQPDVGVLDKLLQLFVFALLLGCLRFSRSFACCLAGFQFHQL